MEKQQHFFKSFFKVCDIGNWIVEVHKKSQSASYHTFDNEQTKPLRNSAWPWVLSNRFLY